MQPSLLLVASFTMTVANGFKPIPACDPIETPETVCCEDELEGGSALDCTAYHKDKDECSHVETWYCCSSFHPKTISGIGPATGCSPSYPDHVMCPASRRKGKRFYDEEVASAGKCGPSAANYNLDQTVAGTSGTNNGVNIDGTSPSIGTGLNTDSTYTNFGAKLNYNNVGGQLPSLNNPSTPVAVSQLPVNEASITKSLFATTLTNLFSSGNPIGETPSDQISYPWADTS